MKRLTLAAAAFLALPATAFAAEPPVEPKKCCCEKMQKDGKDCCADKDKAEQDPHAGHKMDTPKS